MSLQQKLAMRQGQSLVMTPQLSQSIKLLTLSNIELAAFVEDEIERNPFLERDVRIDGQDTDNRSTEPSETTEFSDTVPDLTSNNDLETSAKSLSENIGTSIENVYPDEPDYSDRTKENAKNKEAYDNSVSTGGLQVTGAGTSHDQQIADYTATKETLRDHLMGQLAIAGTSPEMGFIVTDMIDNLDDAGYLRIEIMAIAERLNCPEEQAQAALDLLQSFDPVGIGARNLAECLRLQLKNKDHLDPAMAQVIDNLDLLGKRDFATLKKITNLDMEDLHDVLMEIQTLDPKPGTAFDADPIQHVVPDVLVREAPDGAWIIELNTDTLPRVLVNNNYITEVGNKLNDENSKDFVAQCLQSANWLTKSLDQRAQTILKVAREIVKQQDAFMVHGVRKLRPITLRMVADEIEMHESSVSRVTTNKYMMTPRGLFELKYFFTTTINSSENDEGHSSESVRDQIRDMINSEKSDAVLSDDAIVAALKASGVEIARRTIAKYRDAMNIPSSVQRRREKRAKEAAGR
ncbi:MAG: RNA polymerase factor sigma-54 [Rhizobiaceae bacterium]